MNPLARSSSMVAFSCGIDAETFGSLITLASGRLTSSPSSARSSFTCWSAVSASGNAARTRPASEMSRSSTCTPATSVNALTTGSRDLVASAGASSVWV